MPDVCAEPTLENWTEDIKAWGRQGWDAAAAMRVELAEEQEGARGAIQAMAHQCVKAREEGRREERERIATLLDGEADNDLVLRDISRNHKSDLFGDDLRAALEPPTKEEK